jgi:hypothetical protein
VAQIASLQGHDASTSLRSILAYGPDPKSGVGQRLDDTFRNLFGLLRVDSTLWVLLARVNNRSGDYRIHLVLVGHIQFPGFESVAAVALLARNEMLARRLGSSVARRGFFQK